MIAQKGIYVQEVRYTGFAGRLYGCSRLITSGTSYPAKTGYVQCNSALFLMFLKAPITEIAESRFLSIDYITMEQSHEHMVDPLNPLHRIRTRTGEVQARGKPGRNRAVVFDKPPACSADPSTGISGGSNNERQ